MDVQPIDRLEEKVKQLVGLIDTLRADKARAIDEAARLQQEVDALKARLAERASASAEVAHAARRARPDPHARAQMIAPIDKLNPVAACPRRASSTSTFRASAMRSAARWTRNTSRDIAAFVDSAHGTGRPRAGHDRPVRIAVIAALNIADDLFRTRQDSADGRAQARAVEIERIVDAALEQGQRAEGKGQRLGTG